MDTKHSAENRGMNLALREHMASYPGTIAEVAEAAGISTSTLDRILATSDDELCEIRVAEMFSLASVFGVDPADLVERALAHAEGLR